MKFFKRLVLGAAVSVAALFSCGCDTTPSQPLSESGKSKLAPAQGRMLVYFGTYTRRTSEGIYVFEMDLKSGTLSRLGDYGLATKSENPSFLAIRPDGKSLFAVNEIGDYQGQKTGSVSAYSIDPETGMLQLINQQSSMGANPCHLVVDGSGKNVLVANYGGGSVACLPIDEEGGLMPASSYAQHEGSSVNPRRQKGPHAHSINMDPNNRFAAVGDLGLDQVLTYSLDPGTGTLMANDATSVAPGAGPRHFAFHPSGKFAFVINELHCTVTSFIYDAETGKLTERQTISTLDVPLQKGFSTAEVQVHPGGKFLYGSNRGHDSIVVFAIDQSSGRLTRVQIQASGGTTPRNFGIDPTGNYLLAANQNSDNVVVFRIDPVSGMLKDTGIEVEVPTPVCVKFLRL